MDRQIVETGGRSPVCRRWLPGTDEAGWKGEKAYMEDKQEIVMYLKWLLKATRAGNGIEALVLSSDEKKVTIMFNSGFIRDVNIECDSGIAIIQDVVRALY